MYVQYYPLGCGNAKLEDPQRTLASYSVTDGSTLMLIILERFSLYIVGLNGAMHEVEIPSSDPEVCKHITTLGMWPVKPL